MFVKKELLLKNSKEVCDICKGSGSNGDGTCSACNGSGVIKDD